MFGRAVHMPSALPPRPVVGVWTPSSPAPARFPRRLQRSLDALRARGFQPRLARTATADDGLTAAAPKEIAADLHDLLDDPEIDAVICAVGGYTSLAVVPHIDFDRVAAARKPIIGYSDVTSVLWAVLARTGLITFHGPMVISEWGEFDGLHDVTYTGLTRVLDGRSDVAELREPGVWTDELLWWDAEDIRPRQLQPGGWRCLVSGAAEGWLLPGCASTASRLFGTPYLPDVAGAILCLEAVETGPEEFYGLLMQWSLSGSLDRIAGLVIGRHCRPPQRGREEAFDRVILAALAGRAMPVLVDVDFGHTEPRVTLPVGGLARLDATARTLTVFRPTPSRGS
jgi:muramoyltetrapeptide carboxypeptidase